MRGESIEPELNALDKSLTALRIEYERFFAGDMKLPPNSSRRKVEDTLKRLGNSEIERAAERFRLQTLQSRYNSMREVWEKRLQAREEGRASIAAPRPVLGTLPGAPAGAEGGARPNAGPPSSVEKKRVDFSPLFDRYVAARKSLGEDVSKLRYERFEELVKKQADEIRKRTGSSRLVFEIQTVDGKVKLVGRPSPAKG